MDDSLSFADLYRRHAADVYRFAYWLSGSKAEADDFTAEAFARALAGADDLRPLTVKGFLFTIVRNLHASAHRAPREVALDDAVEHADPAAGPEELVIARERLAFTVEALARLPLTDRAALLMRAEGGLAYEEIAEALGISVGNAKVKVHRARAKLVALNI